MTFGEAATIGFQWEALFSLRREGRRQSGFLVGTFVLPSSIPSSSISSRHYKIDGEEDGGKKKSFADAIKTRADEATSYAVIPKAMHALS